MRFYILLLPCLLLFSSCNAQSTPVSDWKKGPDQSVGELYGHKTAEGVALIVLSYAELSKTSAGPFPGKGTPAEQLARVYNLMKLDARIDRNQRAGTAFVEWGEAVLGENRNSFVARMQPENGGKVFMVVCTPDQFEAIGGEKALFTDPLAAPAQGQDTNRAATNQVANTTPFTKTYPPLLVKRDRRGTELSNNWVSGPEAGLYARANDGDAPRLFRLNVAGDQTSSTRKAIDYALRAKGVRSPRYLELTRMKVSKELLGSDHFITVGQSVLNGRKAHLFISSSKAKGTDVYRVSFRETPATVYEQWGGIASILASEGIINKTDAFGNKLRQVAKAGPRQQVKVYEAAYTKIMYQLAKGIMMAQAATTMRMTELNYDLLLGGDITNPFLD